ncbi:DUF5615 family PIN-like protein [Spirosoma spitsbergense]|jgi:predicted nuclease of predicted toxin-antitoxin system|uniref:DUF5615 family PIN-like protein n=1 Tax=Spirosoma spitsbergense TaxID=431554 RepID=UPI000363C104|nr:DUF5615 family PIN-like protein [Spirosoma spitsbergense]
MPRPDKFGFVADENFDFAVVKRLREEGHLVLAIAESFSSISDPQVLQIAVDREAVLLTEDKDFGELVHRLRMPHCGNLLVRLFNVDSLEKAKRISSVIGNRHEELINNFSVLTNEQLRIRLAK